ncbi:unnamed protein product, partial [Polarella glacialis]
VREDFLKEQRKYYLQTGAFVNLAPKQLAGAGAPVLELDLLKVTVDELKDPKTPLVCKMRIAKDGPVEGFTGYFDTPFRGSPEHPATHEVTLTTGPTAGTATHWGQQLFCFNPPFATKKGDLLECSMIIRRQEKNHRLLQLECKFVLKSESSGVVRDEREETYFVD